MDEVEEVFDTAFMADEEATEVVEPGEGPVNLPAPPIAARLATGLADMATVGPMRRNQLDASFAQRVVQPIAVVGHVVDEPDWRLDRELPLRGRRQQSYLVGRSTRYVRGERKPLSVCQCHALRSLAPLGLADFRRPLFCRREAAVNETLLNVDPAALMQILEMCFEEPVQYPRAHPLLEAAMASLIERITLGQRVLRRAGAQDAQNFFQHCTGVSPAFPVHPPVAAPREPVCAQLSMPVGKAQTTTSSSQP